MEKEELKGVRSVAKAMGLIGLMANVGRPMTLGEIAAAAGLPKSTIHGLLAALSSQMMVEQSPGDGKYRLGIRLFELGCAVSNSWDVTGIAGSFMRELADRTGETAYLSRFSGGETVVIDRVESTNALHVVSANGSRLPVHCTSQGKVFLSQLSGSEVRRILKEQGMQSYTPHTICSVERLEAEFVKVRERGYAIEDGEYRIGLRAVSAPIRGVSGVAEHTIGVVGMFRRVDSEEFRRATELVVRAAQGISRELGYR